MERDWANLEGRQFDLLVCGGGIYGAWTAYDAALRGLTVLIVEKGDWANATSSASSKLIHGGLRYLQSFQLNLVKKSLREREMLFQVAPHRVWPLRFGIPDYDSNPVGKLRLGAGLWLYDRFAGLSKTGSKHGRYDTIRFSKRFPFLKTTGLQGGFDYIDGQTDDARFTLEIVDGAHKQGAVCLNYSEVVGYITDCEGQICGAELKDRVGGKVVKVRSRCSVNVSGQWVDTMLDSKPRLCRLSKGIHLLMPSLGSSEAVLLFSKSDARVFFIIPWYGLTLLGTTDDEYDGDIDNVRVEKEDTAYLLDAVNSYLKTTVWSEKDVLGSFAGVRVLKDRASSSSYLASRDWELKQLNNGLLVSMGGKFTSARQDAAAIVDQVCQWLSVQQACRTERRAFPWAPKQEFNDWKHSAMSRGSLLGLDNEVVSWLIFRHGWRVQNIFDLIEADNTLNRKIFPELPFIYADLLLCVRREMVVHLEDLIRRRMPLLLLKRMNLNQLTSVAKSVATVLNWDRKQTEQEVNTVALKWKIH